MAIGWLLSKAGSEKGVKPKTALLCRFDAFFDDGKPYPFIYAILSGIANSA